MKLKIDTQAKTIQLEQSAKLTELMALVKKLLPNDWKMYSIEAVQYIYGWSDPIYIPSVWRPSWESQPFTITSTGTNETYCVQSN